MKKLILILCIITYSAGIHAQIENKWESKAKSTIYWKEFAPNGNLIVGTKNDETIAYSQKSGEVIWKKSFDYGKFEILPNTPFIYYNSEESGFMVLDPEDGKMLCNSIEMGMENVQSFYPVRAGNNLMVYTQMNDQEQFWLVSLSSGKLLWKKDLDLDKDVEIAGGFISIEEDEEAKGLMCDPVGDGKGGVFVAVHDRLIYINKTGEIKWDIEYPSMFGDQDGFFKAATVKFAKMFPDKTGENLYVFSGGYMTCHKQTDGSLSWEKPVKVTGPVQNLIFDEKGMILLPASDNNAMKKHKFNLVDYETGKTLWGEKGTEFKGGYIQSSYCSKGIILITKAYMNESYFFNIINLEDGSLMLDKPEKIFPGPFSFEEVNGGVLISSAKGANMFKYDSKEMVTNKELKIGSNDILLKADGGSKVYFYTSNKNAIYEFDKSTLEAKEFNQDKIKLEGGDTPKGLDLFADGMVLYSDQNLIKFNWDGNIAYQKYYKAPGTGWFNVTANVLGATFKVLGGLTQVAASMAVAAAVDVTNEVTTQSVHAVGDAYEEINGQDADLVQYRKDAAEYEEAMDVIRDETNKEMQEMAAMGVLNAVDISDNVAAISERFKNSKATKKYVLLMTKDKERGGVGLAVVSKLDGEIKTFIPMDLNEETPNYTVDPFTNYLFWLPAGKHMRSEMEVGTIKAYDLNEI